MNKYIPKIKLTVIGVVWLLAIVIWATMLFGCASNEQEEYDRLHRLINELLAAEPTDNSTLKTNNLLWYGPTPEYYEMFPKDFN